MIDANQHLLFAAAKNKNINEVKRLLEQGIVPNCNGIHTTCTETEHQVTKTSNSMQSIIDSETDIIKKLKLALIKQLEINRQQGSEIDYLTLTLDEFSTHLTIVSAQKEVALGIASQREIEIQEQIAQTQAMRAIAEQTQQDLLLQQQAAEIERQNQAQQLANARIEAARQQAEALASAQRDAQAKIAAENARMVARLELDKPFGGPHHESHRKRRLHVAVLNNDAAEITRLINAGATVDITDSFNHTPLWYAMCQTKNAACINALLAGGAQRTADIDETLAQLNAALVHNPHPAVHQPAPAPRPIVHAPAINSTPVPRGTPVNFAPTVGIQSRRATKRG